jgi:hypothetical protein
MEKKINIAMNSMRDRAITPTPDKPSGSVLVRFENYDINLRNSAPDYGNSRHLYEGLSSNETAFPIRCY